MSGVLGEGGGRMGYLYTGLLYSGVGDTGIR